MRPPTLLATLLQLQTVVQRTTYKEHQRLFGLALGTVYETALERGWGSIEDFSRKIMQLAVMEISVDDGFDGGFAICQLDADFLMDLAESFAFLAWYRFLRYTWLSASYVA